MAYEFLPYPAWRYHAEQPPRMVEDEAEDAALGEGWFDNPLLTIPDVPEPTDPAEIKAAWVEIGELFGLVVDKRWKLAKIQDEVRAHATAVAEEFGRMKASAEGQANVS